MRLRLVAAFVAFGAGALAAAVALTLLASVLR
jgi:hypothetical protein